MYTFGNLSKADVKNMVKRHHAFSRDNHQYKSETHVRCVWFPFEQIEYIYSQLKEENADGLRVYFGNYPEKDSNDKPFKNPDTNTVVFVSTKDGRKDYFTEKINMVPQNRGEQCQTECDGVEFINE